MENVAQQLEMPAAAKQIEHLSDHLELERLILESRPLPVAEGPEEPLSRAEQMAREARQLEARGRLREAMAIWKKIFEMGPMEPLYPTAASEMFRLGRIEAERQNHSAAPPQPQPSRSPPRANPPSTQQLQRQLRIVSVDHRRFPMTGELEEMRVLEIVIAPETPAAARAVEDARVMVTFYDSVVGGAVAVPARAQREPIVIPLSSAQRDAEGRWVVRATYAVPRGFRERDRRITGREYQFHGYLVQVYRGSQLEAVEARPRTLVERKPASR